MKNDNLNAALISRLNIIRHLEGEVDAILNIIGGGHRRGCHAENWDGPCTCPDYKEVVKLVYAGE